MFERKNEIEVGTVFENSTIGKLNIQFVCDECCLPISLYGENIILSADKDEFVTHIFCDLHAEEFLNEK